MSSKCSLEVFVPHTQIKGELKDYWLEYEKKVLPLVKKDDSYEDIIKIIKEKMPKYYEIYKVNPPIPFKIESGKIYVFMESLYFKYVIPEQFERCFVNEEVVKFGLEDDSEYKAIEAVTKMSKAIERLKKHKEQIIGSTNSHYLEYLDFLYNFLSSKPSDAYLRLFSGDVFFYSMSKDELKNYKLRTNED